MGYPQKKRRFAHKKNNIVFSEIKKIYSVGDKAVFVEGRKDIGQFLAD